ncbi:hypothetical protein HK098_006923 [Nowakowskiella sp. JEL0407]|nr:hypothetical protein HK098_006923 [Nowakowskiella sp. JEL0407]
MDEESQRVNRSPDNELSPPISKIMRRKSISEQHIPASDPMLAPMVTVTGPSDLSIGKSAEEKPGMKLVISSPVVAKTGSEILNSTTPSTATAEKPPDTSPIFNRPSLTKKFSSTAQVDGGKLVGGSGNLAVGIAISAHSRSPSLAVGITPLASALSLATNDKIMAEIRRKLRGEARSQTLEQTVEKDKEKLQRRMSLGAALCIPPPPRLSDDMSFRKFMGLTLSAIGIVFGDFAVSPLFVLKAIFKEDLGGESHGFPSATDTSAHITATLHEDVLYGSFSMLIWTITLVWVIKYILLVIKAANNGEGGTFALISLLPMENEDLPLHKYKQQIHIIGMISAAFVLADGFIGPAICVLSAVEGTSYIVGNRYNVLTSTQQAIVPVAIAILLIFFFLQRYGANRAVKFYWPIMVLWFFVILCVGLYNVILYDPTIFRVLSPHYIVVLFRYDSARAFRCIKHTVLAIVGVEMLYADLGHFSRRPIEMSFLAFVYPSVLMSYLGQAAYLNFSRNSNNPEALFRALADPFFTSVPLYVYHRFYNSD